MNRLVEKQQQMFSVVARYLERSGTQGNSCRENPIALANLGHQASCYRNCAPESNDSKNMYAPLNILKTLVNKRFNKCSP